jgi:hypothetical protein
LFIPDGLLNWSFKINCDANINVTSLAAQVIGRRHTAVIGFEKVRNPMMGAGHETSAAQGVP